MKYSNKPLILRQVRFILASFCVIRRPNAAIILAQKATRPFSVWPIGDVTRTGRPRRSVYQPIAAWTQPSLAGEEMFQIVKIINYNISTHY